MRVRDDQSGPGRLKRELNKLARLIGVEGRVGIKEDRQPPAGRATDDLANRRIGDVELLRVRV